MPDLVRRTGRRTMSTPNATMETIVSPTTGPPMDVAVWVTRLAAGAVGPTHSVDRDQLVVVTEGTVQVDLAEVSHVLETGDALRLPAGAERTVRAPGADATTLTIGGPDSHAQRGDADPVPVPWTS